MWLLPFTSTRNIIFNFEDAVLWATARRVGCTTLLTEDLQDGRTLDGVTFRNPFQMSTSDFEHYTPLRLDPRAPRDPF